LVTNWQLIIRSIFARFSEVIGPGVDQNIYQLRKFFFELRCDMKTRSWFWEAAGISFCGSLLIALTGCAGYSEGPSGGVAEVGPFPPDVVVFGGDYDNGREVQEYSQRGYESRHDYDSDRSPNHDHDHQAQNKE
jgi:hypothetical protein